MGKVMAICISEIRGVQKKNVHTARLIENWGVEHDAHAGNWHRQVSLLSYETIQDFNRQGAGVIDGAFGENLVISGYDFTKMKIGTPSLSVSLLWQYMPEGAGVTAAAHKERAEAMLPPSLSVLYLCCQSRRSFSSSYSRT